MSKTAVAADQEPVCDWCGEVAHPRDFYHMSGECRPSSELLVDDDDDAD